MRSISRRILLGAGAVGIGAAAVDTWRWLAPPPGGARAAADNTGTSLFRDAGSPVLGNPHGTLMMAEFFDYRCPYCRQMHPLIRRLLATEHDIRFVAKEWPVFGGPSVTAAKVALAASWQGKFAATDDALFKSAGPLDDARVRRAAQRAGVDMRRLDKDLSARALTIEHVLGEVALQAASLGLQGTPGFVIGRYLVPGAMREDQLFELVAKARGELRAQRPLPAQH